MAIIKHANPCGIAISSVSVADAHRKAHECDPLSAFGGVIAANTEVSVEMAEYVSTIFTEVIIAPAVRSRAPWKRFWRARRRQSGCCGGLRAAHRRQRVAADQRGPADAAARPARRARRQPGELDPGHRLTGRPGHASTDLVFAWRTCRAVKSNAIVIAADGATVGVGMGQVNRVDAAKLAVERGGDRVRGAVAASDAFSLPVPPTGSRRWPPPGVTAIVHPGGSVRDEEVTAAAGKVGVTLYLTGARHFAH